MINNIEIYVGRQDIFADTFCDVRVDLIFIEDARFFVFLKDRAISIYTPNLNIRIFLF